MKDKRKKQIKIAITITKFAILVFIVIGIPLIIYLKNPTILDQFKSLDAVNDLLDQNKLASLFIYIGIQIFQIVVSIIPGFPIQAAAGYAFNIWIAYAISLVGIGLGTLLTFYISKLLGTDFVHLIFGEEKVQRYIKLMQTKKALIILFLLFLIPGVPKDMLSYVAGVSGIRFIVFLSINLLARTPALIGSIYIGSFFRSQSYIGIYIIVGIAIFIFVLSFIFKDKLLKRIDKLYEKAVKPNSKENI